MSSVTPVPPARPARHPSRSANGSMSSLARTIETSAEKTSSIPVSAIPSVPNGSPLPRSHTLTARVRSSTLGALARSSTLASTKIAPYTARSTGMRKSSDNEDENCAECLQCGCFPFALGFIFVHLWSFVLDSALNALRGLLALTLGHVLLHAAHPTDAAYVLGTINNTMALGAIGGVLAGLPLVVFTYIIMAAAADRELEERSHQIESLRWGGASHQLLGENSKGSGVDTVLIWIAKMVCFTAMGAAAGPIGASVLLRYVHKQMLSGPHAAAAGAFGMFLLTML